MDLSAIHTLWLLVCASLVFLMQAGFMCLEAGLTRAKNSINVASKNLTDFSISLVIFWAFGFALMFGDSTEGWIGGTGWLYPMDQGRGFHDAFFLFQAMFCSTAATILSGAVAERMRFASYILITFLLAGIIYPIFGHWVWNGTLSPSPTGWLEAKGFVDFAGSTVVHSLGGWVALATLLVVGPRTGRFLQDGKIRQITGNNLPLSMLGIFFFWIAWLGFNGGSTFSFNNHVSGILAKTVFAGATGALSALFVGWAILKIPKVELLMKGSLAGLVAITASCDVVSTGAAVVIGGIGGVVMLGVDRLLEAYQIDDAVGAIPVHLGAGIWGTLAVALFGEADRLGTGLGTWDQLQIQVLGIAVCCLWAFGVSYLLLRIFNRIFPFRVTPEQEHIGLNVSEHGATTELLDLLVAMDAQAKSGDMNLRVPVEPFTEVGQIAERYNVVMAGLQATTAKTEAIVRDIRDGIITFGETGVIASFNPGAEKLFGYPAKEVRGQPVTMLFSSLTTKELHNLEHIVNSQLHENMKDSTSRIFVGVRKDHTQFHADLTLSKSHVGRDYQGTILIRDITERQEAEQRFRMLAESSPIGIFHTDSAGQCVYTNPHWQKIYDVSPDEPLRSVVERAIHPDDVGWVSQAWEKALRTTETFLQEFRIFTPNGHTHWVQVHATPIFATGPLSGFVGTTENVTARRLSQEALQQSEAQYRDLSAELKASNKELEAFSYSVSHDLRAPLRHIDGFVRQLFKREGEQLNPTSMRYLNIIAESAERMGTLIDDLLALSRVSRTELKLRRLDMSQIVLQVREELEAQNPDSCITWDIGSLPTVEGDPSLLRIVWTNLISNAMKYSGLRRDANIAMHVNDAGETEIFIRDNGVGFDPQYSHKLFGVFQRLHGQDEFPGTGIGLATVLRIIHRHHGRVWATSQVDQGATFFFTLKGM